jgi:putative oxidoreductase
MRRIISTIPNPAFIDLALLITRVLVALTMLTHGTPKLVSLTSHEAHKFSDPIGIGPEASMILTIFAEFVCSILILFGALTRLAVIPLIVTMMVVTFVVQKSAGFEKQELSMLYMLVYFLLLVLGSGRYSVDRMIEGRMDS